jgi:hypothetical protein
MSRSPISLTAGEQLALAGVCAILNRGGRLMGVTTFSRYTNLAATIHMLRSRKITLLNPATWDDTNDSYYMAEYKRLKRAKTVLALCFTESDEQYHHWRVFSHGRDGVRIEFNKDKLLAVFDSNEEITKRYVDYRKIDDLREGPPIQLEDLPFLKRLPYTDEREFRLVYTSTREAKEHKDYPVGLDCVRRITLSPWMPKALVNSVRTTLKALDGCGHIKMYQSTLVSNEGWKALTARVATNNLV